MVLVTGQEVSGVTALVVESPEAVFTSIERCTVH